MSDFVNSIRTLKLSASAMHSAGDIDYVAANYRTFARDVHNFLATLESVVVAKDTEFAALRTMNEELLSRIDALNATNKANIAELQKARAEINLLAAEKAALIAVVGASSDPEPVRKEPEVHTFTIKVIGDLPEPLRMMLEALRVTE